MRENLKAQVEVVNRKAEEYDRLHKDAVEKLESLAGMSAAEAKDVLMETMKEEAKTQAMSYINDVMDEARMTAGKEAKRIVINTIQRIAPETAIENAVTVFNIENDEMKGRIIGREGRNIRALEAATGVEIVVDDTFIPPVSRKLWRKCASSWTTRLWRQVRGPASTLASTVFTPSWSSWSEG